MSSGSERQRAIAALSWLPQQRELTEAERREAIVAAYGAGETPAEIAAQYRVSLAAVLRYVAESQIHDEGVRRLRQLLTEPDVG